MSKRDDDDKARVKFVMSEPQVVQRLDVFGVRHSIWNRMLSSMTGRGYVNVTQKEIAVEFDMTVRAVQKHYKVFRDAGMLERAKDKDGRVKWLVAPENYWQVRVSDRNKWVRERKSAKANERFTSTGVAMSVIQGGKVREGVA